MMRHFAFVVVLCAAMAAPFATNAREMNCTVRQNSNFVDDMYGMYDEAANQSECLEKCRAYAKHSIESLAGSDQITKLSWVCAFNKRDIHTEKLK